MKEGQKKREGIHMRCKDVINKIEQEYPREFAMEWDNVGLLAGREEKETVCIYVALDATDEVIAEAIAAKADLLITHHPLIFKGVKQINDQDFLGRRLIRLIQADISYYAMHTNYDVLGMAEAAGRRLHLTDMSVLDVTGRREACGGWIEEGIGKVADLEEAVSLKDYCEQVKDAFGLTDVRVFGDLNAKIRRVALCPGSGKSEIEKALKAEADVLVTGDIGHHEGIDAAAQGMAVVDAGHYGMEHIFVEEIAAYLRKNLTGIKVRTAPVCHPFETV